MNTRIKTYEIYCEKFSRIIQAKTLSQAVEKFDLENPFENIICAEDVEYKAQSAPAPVGEAAEKWCIEKKIFNISNLSNERIYELMQEYASLNKPIEDKWISVEDDLPNDGEEVLVFTKGWKRIAQKSYEEYTDQNKKWFKESFSHWQPLPSPPNK